MRTHPLELFLFLLISSVEPSARILTFEFSGALIVAAFASLCTILFQEQSERPRPAQWVGRIGLGLIGGLAGFAVASNGFPNYDIYAALTLSAAGGILGPVLEPSLKDWFKRFTGTQGNAENAQRDKKEHRND